jgi:hypothetical protein
MFCGDYTAYSPQIANLFTAGYAVNKFANHRTALFADGAH